MPRRRPPPDERQRSSKACVACKASKIKCDAQTPCTACEKRGKASLCIYAGIDGRRSSSKKQSRGSTGSAMNRLLISQAEASPVSIILDSTQSTSTATPARPPAGKARQSEQPPLIESESLYTRGNCVRHIVTCTTDALKSPMETTHRPRFCDTFERHCACTLARQRSRTRGHMMCLCIKTCLLRAQIRSTLRYSRHIVS